MNNQIPDHQIKAIDDNLQAFQQQKNMGTRGEQIARILIKNLFNPEIIMQIDWMFNYKGKWIACEVKHKELFKPPPFEGAGLSIQQVKARLKFYNDTGIRCLFIVIDSDSNGTFINWLDVLEAGDHFDTRNGIRVYNIKNFKQIKGGL